MDKLKVVWICHLSNSQIREKLKFGGWSLLALLRKQMHINPINDFAIWNTNAIREFENFEDIELHIVAPHYQIATSQEFNINGVHYHFIKSEDDNIFHIIKKKITKKTQSYKRNTQKIIRIINSIQPHIIHMIGAENPYYGESALALPTQIPFIVSLQTLMCDPKFEKNYPISHDSYLYRSKIEYNIIRRADYVGTTISHFRDIIKAQICPTAKFLDLTLAVGEDINVEEYKKTYDFVYYAADISKSIDYALEAFAIAKQQHPNITLHVVGKYSESTMTEIKKNMQKLGIGEEVSFTGRLATREDVIQEIRKARFALLPLKVDMITSTIREAMANGLPVVTTETPLTPKLNQNRESILLSNKGDFCAMADNMCKLLSNDTYVTQLKRNAAETLKELYSNKIAMQKWKDCYYQIIENL